jgi:hypothetical protein
MRQTLLFALNAMTVGHHIQLCDVHIAAIYSTRRGTKAALRRRALTLPSLNTTYFSAVRPVILARLLVTVRPAFVKTRSEATLVAGKDSVAVSSAGKACGTNSCYAGAGTD